MDYSLNVAKFENKNGDHTIVSLAGSIVNDDNDSFFKTAQNTL